MGLENILNKCKESISDSVDKFVLHPKLMGACIGFSYLAAQSIHWLDSPMDSEQLADILNVGFGSYVAIGLLKDYIFKKRDFVEPENKSLVGKIGSVVYNNPYIFSFAPGLASLVQNSLLYKDMDKQGYSYGTGSFIFWSLYSVSRAALSVRRANEWFTKSYKRLKSSNMVAKASNMVAKASNMVARASDFVLERSWLSSASVGLGIFSYYVGKFEWGMKNRPVASTMLAGLLAFVPSCGAYAAHTLLSGLFHSSSLNLIGRNLRISFNALFGRKDKAVQELTELLDLPLSPEHKASIHIKLAGVYARQNKMDYALVNMRSALDLTKQKRFFLHPLDWFRDVTYINKFVSFIKSNYLDKYSSSPLPHVRRSISALTHKNYHVVLKELNYAVELSKDSLDVKVIKALELDAMNKSDKANEQWKDILISFFENYDIQKYLKSIGQHKVYHVDFDNLIKDTLILKQGDEGDLLAERDNILYLNKKINKAFFNTVRPVGIAEYKGNFFLSELLIKGRRLTEAFYKSKDYDLFSKTARFLALVHAYMPFSEQEKDYLGDLEAKLNASSLPDYLKQLFLENSGVLIKDFQKAPLVFDRDGHSDNWFVSDKENIVLLDLAERGIIRSVFDSSKLVNRGDFFPRNQEGDKIKDNILIGDYFNLFNEYKGRQKVSENDFLNASLSATPFKALTQFLFSLNRRDTLPAAYCFIRNGIHDTGRLLDEGYVSSRADSAKYSAFKRGLQELENYSIVA